MEKVKKRNINPNLCDTFHHVLNVWADSFDSGQFLSDTEPFLNKQLLLADLLDVDTHVPEITSQRTARPSHNHLAGFDRNFNWSTTTAPHNIIYHLIL